MGARVECGPSRRSFCVRPDANSETRQVGMKSVLRSALVVLSVIAISLLHYLTPLHLHYLHDIFQRLYYLPIIMAAFWYGFRGGLACAILVSIVYAPHILFQWGGTMTMDLEKYLEIFLYNIVGGITGYLSEKERQRNAELQETARGLTASYEKLRIQSERIMTIEEQLRRAEKLSTLGEMAAVLAHEIRNPLGSIRGTAEILNDDFPPGSPKHEFIEIQIKETERLNRVVAEFLQMARPQPTELQVCSVTEELETMVTLMANEARKRDINLFLQPLPTPIHIRADGEKLRQALLNIIINAVQATPPAGTVTLSATADRLCCDIVVQDTGSGIAGETLKRIFDPFFTTKEEGTGLGLTITRKIIESHGGTIAVVSDADHGTTVTIRLPLPGPELGETP